MSAFFHQLIESSQLTGEKLLVRSTNLLPIIYYLGGKKVYTAIIQGIPVATDPSLLPEQINLIIAELKQAWAWEGRQVGRVEIVCSEQMIHIVSYEKPVFQCIPLDFYETKGA